MGALLGLGGLAAGSLAAGAAGGAAGGATMAAALPTLGLAGGTLLGQALSPQRDSGLPSLPIQAAPQGPLPVRPNADLAQFVVQNRPSQRVGGLPSTLDELLRRRVF